MRTVRATVTTLLGGFLLLAAVTVIGPSVAAAPADNSRATGSTYDLTGDAVGTRVDGLQRWRIRKWPGKTIRYHETIPAKWDWSLDQAVEHWNASGGGIRLVESGKRHAQLSIGYGDTGGADGVGTLGFQRTNYIHLAPGYKHANQYDPAIRVWVGRLFTHELGHVLGFNHTGGQCSLMYPVYDFGLCPPLPDDAPGYYNCRWIDRPLLRRFVAMYGGRAKRPPVLCLIEALPDPLGDVRFSGGQAEDAPVRVTWRAPTRIREGTKLWITVWSATSCAKEPVSWERRVAVDPRAGSWTDPSYGQGRWCYGIELLNRYGAGPPAVVRELERWAPVPDAPVVGSPTWVPADGWFRVSWTPPDDSTHLEVVRSSDDPSICPSSYDEDYADRPYEDGPNRWLVWAGSARECVTFFAVSSWGSVSPGTQVVLQVPAPAVTPTVGSIRYDSDAGVATVPASLADDSYQLGVEVIGGPCPGTPPADAGWSDGYEGEPGIWTVYPESQGDQCAMFAALDGFGQHGPVVSRTFTVP